MEKEGRKCVIRVILQIRVFHIGDKVALRVVLCLVQTFLQKEIRKFPI